MISEKEVLIMRHFSVILAVLSFVSFATISAAQEKKAGEYQTQVKIVLPEAVTEAISKRFPKAEIDKMDQAEEGGITLYDIEFKADLGEIEIAADGTFMEVTTIVEMKDVPSATAAVFNAAAEGATIKEIEKSEILAEIKEEGEISRIVMLATPSVVYEVELVKGKEIGEIQVAPDGKIVEALKWRSSKGEED
jgi:hypothetical protein